MPFLRWVRCRMGCVLCPWLRAYNSIKWKQLDSFQRVNRVGTMMVRERSGALMLYSSPHVKDLLHTVPRTAQTWPVAVALNLGFTSERSHPVPSLRWGCGNTIKSCRSCFFCAPLRDLTDGCHLSDGCHPSHDYGKQSNEMLN